MTEEKRGRIISKLTRELGDTILTLLKDPDVIEIMLNSDSTLWVERLGQDMKFLEDFNSIKAQSIIGTIASFYDTICNADKPILECELPIDGSRFEGLLPPLVTNPSFTIRKKALKIFTLQDYKNDNILQDHQMDKLQKAIKERKNILVVGGTGSGKTTFCNAIIHSISELTPEHRIIVIEDTAELQCSSKNKLIIKSNEDNSMLKLLKATMRLRPDRIIVGEVRGGEALDLLKAWNTGHSGGIATIHANSATAGLIRVEQLIAEVSQNPQQQLIAEAIDLIVFIEKTKQGRSISEIKQLKGFENGHYQISDY
ncbi:P-type conjugative transfer ATPase TrbB [Helicobacter monodelphidis]|uniref:P-type conjugative transfer ATPase TrbB n=1 Tax=Helicobacter sp. 15-1451 TaxID=2004995 RepID=UPI000DCEA992|nr:P-type conjugative transfer ATPase TrbB [Helicobacter sp. 15-1451]RAX56477.1 P-type conjugative transfer ATPase TrbB [Helicobacter sp. 15-1451]